MKAFKNDKDKLAKENETLANKLANIEAKNVANEFFEFKGFKVLHKYFENADMAALNSIGDELKQKYPDYIILLVGGNEGALPLASFVGGKALDKNKAGDIIRHVSGLLGGSGGGRPNMANGRGKNKDALEQAFKAFEEFINV